MIGFEEEGPLSALGMQQWMPELPVEIGQIIEGGAAERDGLLKGDILLSANGEVLRNWMQWVELVRAHPEQPLEVELLRNDIPLTLVVTPKAIEDGKEVIGQIGAANVPWEPPQEMLREVNYSPIEAFVAALQKTYDFIHLTLGAIGKMIVGMIALDNLSGPITIAKVAGSSAGYGLESFISFIAYLSISLGILNLLPVPVLDGGHLMYYLIEMVKGKPVSERIQHYGNSFGLALLVMFMGLAIYNDLMRF
jgi:regulator of sigma E protease